MDDDLLNPIDINLDDYADDTEEPQSASKDAEGESVRAKPQPAAPAANPVPDPAELDRLLSDTPAESAASNATSGSLPNPAPPAPPKSGVPPLPDMVENTPNPDAPPVQPVQEAAADGDDDTIIESGDIEEDSIRPIDVMAPHNTPSQFAAAPPDVPPLPDLPPMSAPAEEISNIDVHAGAEHQASAQTPASEDGAAAAVDGSEDKASERQANINRVSLGEEVNLTRMDPGLKRVMIGMGWDAKVFSDDTTPDLDVSLFLLNKDNLTREDQDFVFYNNMEACEGGVKHHGDNRTGAGDGDDENITVKLSDIPFDIVGMEIVLTIYQGLEKEQSFKDVENIFFRLVNADTQIELMRLELDTVVGAEKAVGVKIGRFNRVGPNWFFEASATPVPKGLAECATEYGIVVAEMT